MSILKCMVVVEKQLNADVDNSDVVLVTVSPPAEVLFTVQIDSADLDFTRGLLADIILHQNVSANIYLGDTVVDVTRVEQ